MRRVKKWPDGEMLCAAFRNGGGKISPVTSRGQDEEKGALPENCEE